MTVITEQNFAEIVAANKSLMIDFWATWCGPCRMLAPTVDAIASEYEGKVAVGKCDVDDAQELAIQLGIRNIPTLVFFKDGKVVDRLVGLVSKQEIEKKLAEII